MLYAVVGALYAGLAPRLPSSRLLEPEQAREGTFNVPGAPYDLSQYTYNSPSNPAAAGQAIEFLATGAGVWNLEYAGG